MKVDADCDLEAGPRTPEDSENSSSSPTASEAGSASPEFTSKSGLNRIASSESEEEENEGEDLGKVTRLSLDILLSICFLLLL